MKSTRIRTDENGYINGIFPANKQPDFETIFPAGTGSEIEDMRDEYGNLQWKISTKTETVINDFLGIGKLLQTIPVVTKVPQKPTPEQAKKVRKKNIGKEIHKTYSVDDEIASLRKAILHIYQQISTTPEKTFHDQSTIIQSMKDGVDAD